MNVIQMHERTKFYCDHTRSPRFLRETINESLNSSTLEIINNRYDDIKNAQRKGKKYAFQAVQRIRDELYTIVKESSTITATGNELLPVASFPSDYKYILQMWATIDGNEYRCIPTSYDENLGFNFKKPQIAEPARVYNIEGTSGQRILFGDSGTLNSGRFWYLSEPVLINHGLVRTAPYTFTTLTTVICMTSTCIVDAITYTIGQYISVAPGSNITAGQVVENYTNSDLPNTIHDEICIRASRKLMGSVDDYNKASFEQNEEVKA